MQSKKGYVSAGIGLLVVVLVFIWIVKARDQESAGQKRETELSLLRPENADRADSERFAGRSGGRQALEAPDPEQSVVSPEVIQQNSEAPAQGSDQNLDAAAQAQKRAAADAALQEIESAALSYDTAELPVIEPYLLNADPEIRAAALDAMLTVGDAAASPLLREAAANAPTPQEAVRMLEAADYLELPSATLNRGKNTTSGKKKMKTSQRKKRRLMMQPPRNKVSQ